MKGKISLLTRKVFATIISLAMSIPPTAFANNQAPHVYDANSSVMGLAKTKEEPTSKVENTDETKLVKDLGTYELEITSKLDESLEKISYTIKAKKKQASKPTSKEEKDLVKTDEAKDDLSLTLTKTPTSNIKNIKLGSANIATDTNEPDFKEDLASLVIKSKANDEIIYELSADVNKAKDQRAYDLILGLKEADKEAKVFAYNLKAETGVTIVDNKTVDLIKLVNKEEKSTKAKGKFTKEGILGGLFASHDSITWTDYILNEKDSNKEITYNFDLDSNQDPTGSKINLDYYEWAENGFEIKKEFSQTIDFAKKVKFEIPKGYIAKLSLKTQVSKKNTKVKSYSLNNSVLKNPIYIEGNEDENKKEEEDPLPADKNEKPADKPAEDKKSTSDATVDNPTDQNKKDKQPAGKESSTEIKIDDKTAEDKKEKNSETQIVATDSSGNEVKVEERNKPKEENNKPQISALILNKDSLIAKLKAENKLTSKLETAIGDLTDILNSYNEEKITDQELKDFTKSLAERNQIAKADLKSYLESILSGLNKQTNKAANINYDEIITYAYPEKKESEPLVEIKSDEKLLANSDSQEQKENQNKETLAKIPSAKKEDDEREDRESFEENSVAKAFDKDLAKLKEAAENEDKKEKGVFEGLKSLVGQTDLQKADKELKKALADEKNGIKEIQNLLDSFEEKYKLSRADQAKLLEDNGDAIRALIEKHKDSNIRPLMLFGAQNINGLNLDGKKFHVRTIFQTSSAAGPIQPYQFFDVHLDKKLTVNDPSSLKDITYNHRVVAKPKYIKKENKIRYQIQGVIPENLNIPLNIPVDYNQENISLDDDGTFTVTNKVSGMGIVNPPKDLLPVKVDKDGNIKGTIIEPGRNDVNQIIEPDDSNYKVNVDALGNPEIEDGKIKGYNWKIHVSSDTNLGSLGFDANFTTVKGSGLGEIQNLKINNKDSGVSTNPIAGKLGITDSKHYKHEGGDRDLNITFHTPVINTQESYMLDLSFLVKDKLSAKRLIVTSGYSPAAVSDDTPTRIGMNNRTSIMGEFSSNYTSKWTVTDAISTGDDKDEEGKKKTNPLPLATRTVNDQTVATSKYAIYQIDTNGGDTHGKMVVKVPETDLHGIIPDQGTATNEDHTIGTIAAYEYDTKLDSPTVNKPKMSYTLGGVEISKEVDLQVEQDWILDKEVKIPKQHIEAVNANDHNQVLGRVDLPAAKDFSRTRRFVIPNVKVWEIGEKGKATRLTPKIKQDLPKVDKIEFKQENGSYITKDYKYIENYNYYKYFSREYYLHNRGTEQVNINYGNFTLVKTDSTNPKEKLKGARFKMLHGPEVITDENGEAKFSNLEPGSYTLIETKAPEGYKLNEGDISISVDKEGRVTASGKNTSVTGGSTPTTTIKHNVYPDYMNAMHYGSIDSNGNITTYIFLKALGNTRGGSTNRDTRVNINLANINNPQYQVYDISPLARGDIQKQMNLQTLNSTNLNPVLNKEGWEPIRGRKTNNGYTIGFPKDRFGGGDDWGFLIEVKGQAQQGQQPSLSYDWITDKLPNEAKLTNNNVAISSTTAGQDTVVTVTNVKFPRKPVEVMKVDQNQKPLQGATFVIRNSNGDPISTKISGTDGKVDFGEQPVGTYTIEEIESPDEYQESPIVFDVTVDEAKQVFYKARFKNGEGTPVRGKDYWIENEVVADQDTKAQVIEVVQSIELSENNPGELGERKGIWEAYRYESYTYKAHVVVNNSQPKKRFEIQFDPNLDFTQYVNKIPSIKNKQGVEIADAFFDYDTNLLTYVFNENSDGGKTDFDFVIDGIIPSKYYAPNNGNYDFVIKAAPGNSTEFSQNSNPILPFSVQAYYDYYDVNDGGSPAQLYYFRDVYKGDDDNWYVKAIAYYNPLASRAKESRTLYFNWFSTNWRGDIRIARWPANGNLPAFALNDVKIYRSLPTVDPENPRLINNKKNMPLSMGVRPETDPGTYELVYSSAINPSEFKSEKQNQITLTYDPSEIKTTGTINQWSPLKLDMPSISSQNEGYVIEQTFKVTDLEKFRNMFRAFYMTNKKAPPRQESAFASKVNTNIAVAEQAKKEIPKYYSQKIMMANNKYTPAKFRIRKRDLSDSANYLKGAVFTLTDKDERIIARSTGQGGILTFENLKPGNYRLEETNAPKGFIKSNKTWSVNVASDSTVTITEIGLNSTGANYVGQDLMIEVSNKPFGKNFVVYKRGDDRKPLAGAKFTIKEENSEEVFTTGESNQDGVVDFGKKLVQGKRYILEESEAPIGYKKLDKKWVLVVGKDSVEVYDYIDGPKGNTNPEVNVSLLGEKGTRWVDVANRNFSNWTIYDHRWSGYAGGSRNPFKLGTRIIGINREKKYVIQRYVINPEGESVGPSRLEIHKELPEYTNSKWYDGNEVYKIFKLDKRVTENVEDIKLKNYTLTILDNIKAQKYIKPNNKNDSRMLINLPPTDKPIIIDVKVPYDDERGGIGTGMDYYENYNPTNGSSKVYWKADHYESVSIIKDGDLVKAEGEAGNILGAHVSDNSLDISNEKKRYNFEFKKIREKDPGQQTPDSISGATFKLTGPYPSDDTKWSKSGEDGMVHFNNLIPGSYTLAEHAPAQGYEPADTTWTVTVGEDGKFHFKDNNVGKVNEDPNLQWQKADTSQDNPNRHNGYYTSNGSNGKIETKITEVNIKLGKFRQVYILNALPEKLKNPFFEIHAQEENRNLNLTNTKILSVKLVGSNSKPDRLEYIGADIKCDTKVYSKTNEKGDTYERIKLTPENLAGENKTVAVTIESDIPASGSIGTGMDFINFDKANHYWAAQWYDTLQDIKLNPIKGGGTSRSTYSVDGEGTNNYTKPTYYTNAPLLMKNVSGLVERNVALRKPQSETYSNPLSTLAFRSAFFATDSLEIGDETIPGAQRAGDGWEKVEAKRSKNVTTNSDGRDNETRITEINKAEGKYRQIFLVNRNGYDVTGPTYNFHAQPLSANVLYKNHYSHQKNFEVLSIRPISSNSTLDNIQYIGNETLGKKDDAMDQQGQWYRYKFTLDRYDRRPLAIEVEYTYPKQGAIGLGMDYWRNSQEKVWAAQSYGSVGDINCKNKINIDPNITNGSVTSNVEYEEKGNTVTLNVSPTNNWILNQLTVKDADGKDIQTSGSGQVTFTMPDKDVEVKASFRPLEGQAHTISLDTNIQNGSLSIDDNKAYNGQWVTVKAHPNTGYEFDKLIVTDSSNRPVQTDGLRFTMPDSDVKVSAVFKTATYSITLNPTSNGEISVKQSQNIAEGTPVIVTAKPRNGYGLVDLTYSDGKNTYPIDKNTMTFKMPKSNVTISARFGILRKISILQQVNGYVESDKSQAAEGEDFTLTIQPGPGYMINQIFINDNWVKSLNSQVVNGQLTQTMGNSDLKFKVTFKRDLNKAIIKYGSNGGNGYMATEEVVKNTYYTLPKNEFSPPPGRIFSEWNCFGRWKPGDKVKITGDFTIIPIWKNKTNNDMRVSFDNNGGSGTMIDDYVTRGGQYKLPPSTFTGPNNRAFKAWKVDGNEYQPGDTITINGPTNVQAVWENDQVTVSFDSNTGSGSMNSIDVDKDSNFTLPDCKFQAPNGKEFKAWKVNGREYQPNDTIRVSADTTVTAIWKDKPVTQKKYTVWVENTKLSAKPNQDVEEGTEVKVTVTPDSNEELVRLYYNDGNKDVDIDKTTKTFNMPASNVTVRATYKQKSQPQPTEHTITSYDDGNGNSVTASVSKANQDVSVNLTVNTNSDYTLEGIWIEDQSGNKIKDISLTDKTFTMPDKNVVVKARFKKVKFNITTSVNDPNLGSVSVDKDKASEGEEVTVTVNPKDSTVEISDVNVGGTSIGPQLINNKYTFKVKDKNVHISVTFNLINVEKHDVTVNSDTRINFNIDLPGQVKQAPAGTKVTFNALLKEGYDDLQITGVRVNGSQGEGKVDVVYDKITGDGSFIMPAYSVSIIFDINQIPPNNHKVKVTKPDHGSVTVDKQYAGFEETITLTAIADEGYELDRFIVTDANNDEVPTSANTFKMPNSAVTATAIFKKKSPPPDPNDPGDDVTDQLVTIPNKQAGIELKIFKKDTRGRPLEGGQFKLTKVDKNYQNPDKTFMLTAVSDKDGRVEFLDQTGKKAKLQKGYYTIEEVKPPTGYKQASSKWNVEVKDDKGKMHATYFGPEQTSVEYLISDKVNLGNTTNSNDEIGWASKIKNIDTNAGTFVQRIMIDLRGYKGTEKLNLQVVPKHKKEEYDRAGVSPDIVKEGVKTAYRTSYRINDPSPDLKAEDVLNSYDLSKNNVAMVNTARWRPFDWGFDEDQLNLEPGGVYFIDIEGYFDPAIITGTATKEKKVVEGVSTNVDPYNRTDITKDDLGKIALDFQLFKGERHFQQAVYNKDVPGKIEWKSFPKASYQAGAVAIAKTKPDGWSGQWGKNGKYENWKGLEGGRISPALPKKPYKSIETSADISSLYTANNDHNAKEIPKEGLELTNEEESYNITFSKHGRDDPKITDNNDDRITKNRLEGAIFRLEQKIGNDYVAMPGSYVSSAFNGFFGFRGLKPGRYRLVEVQAPAGYRPINDAVLYMTIAYEKEQINQATGEITPGRGAITLEYASGNGIVQYAPDDTKKYNSGKLVDFVTSGTAKNMGKIINEKPGKGKVTVKKTDEIGQALTGAKFRLVRVSKAGIQDQIDKKPQQGGNTIEGVYNGTVDKDGNLTFEQLPIGQYILEELEPAPGHKLTGQKWYFTVGGKDLDPYSGPMERTGIDQSKNISMTSEMKVVRPNDEDKTADEGDGTIHPNYGHMMKFDNKFTIKQGATISPGDFFVVKMTDKTDLKGIFNKEAISGLDIFADGVGTIAKADYDDVKGTITYTFTEYARTYQLLNFESTYVGHINLAKTKVSTNNVSVGFWMNDDESTKKTIDVSYELGTKDATDWYGNNINLSSKITYFEPETGRFEHIIYINRDGKNSNGAQFVYKPGKNVSNLRYELFKVNNYYGKNYTMPPSYSVNYSNWFMTRVVNNYYNRTVNDYNPVYQSFNNDYYSTDPSLDRNDSYVVRITGNISDGEDKTAYTPEARLRRFNDYGYVYMWAKREDEVYSRLNTNEAKADLTISAINPRNKIIFRKTDQNYKTLAGAIFGLVKYKSTDDQTGKEIWEEVKGEDGQELTAKTGEDGLASFEKLPEGRYALVEKIAPKGYTRIETHILEFMVSKNGIITRTVKENGKAEDKEITEVVGTSPIGVINYKDIDFVKIDANSGKFLPGAKFKIWYKEKQTDKYRKLTNDEYSKQIYSDSDGKFKIHVTRNGYYALEEIEAPRGYKKPDDVEFVREFKLENGRVLVLQKDPLKASYRVGNKGAMESRILSVDQDKKQFTQRIVLNPHGKEVTFDGPGTYLRFHGNGWKIIPHLSVGGKIKVALLPKDGKIDDLKPSDYIEVDASGRTTTPEVVSRYQIKGILDSLSSKAQKKLYKGPEEGKNNITTDATLVVEYTGQLTGSGENEKKAEIKQDIYFDLTYLDQMIYKLDLDEIQKNKPTYVEKSELRPVDIENTKLHEIKFRKVDAKVNEKTGKKDSLAGAEFKLLYRKKETEEVEGQGGKKELKPVEWTELHLYEKTIKNAGGGSETERIWLPKGTKDIPVGFKKTKDTFTSEDQTGNVEFKYLLDPGYYAIQETKAPAGFALPLTENKIVKKFVIRDGELIMQLDEKKTSNGKEEIDHKEYVKRDDGYFYEKVGNNNSQMLLTNPQLSLDEYKQNKLTYVWSINPYEKEVEFTKPKLAIDKGALGKFGSLKVTATNDGSNKEYNLQGLGIVNGWLDLSPYLTPTKEGSGKTKTNLTIAYTVEMPNEGVEKEVKSTLVGMGSEDLVIEDKFKFDSANNQFQKNETNIYKKYVDANLVHTDKEGNLEVENRKVELPKALGTGNILTYTLAGLAVMLAGVFIYFKKKQAIKA